MTFLFLFSTEIFPTHITIILLTGMVVLAVHIMVVISIPVLDLLCI